MLPLSGITVLDLTHHIAGPFATRLLAAYGATVLKVERPGHGDPMRMVGQPAISAAPNARFLYLNTGKQSITLDLKRAEGRARLLELAARADAVVENFAPGVLHALGLDWPVLRAVNPALVLVSISNYGQSGPRRDWAGTNLTLFAAGGQMSVTGEPEREPLVNGGTQALMQAGLHGFAATVTAVFGARAHGAGTHVDISIQEVQASALEGVGPTAIVHGLDAGRGGNLPRATWGIYPCADGYVGCACLDRNIPALIRALDEWWARTSQDTAHDGAPPLFRTPEFRNPLWRTAHNDEVVALLMSFFLDHTKQQLHDIAQRHRVPFGYIATVDELLAWPALHEKGFWQELDHPHTGRLRYPGPPFTVDGGGFRLTRAPLLGEHDDAHQAPSAEGRPPDHALGPGDALPPNLNPATDRARGGADAQTPPPGPARSGSPAVSAHARLPLEGIRIIDLTMVWAGPYATRLLADMGADVIKVEGVANADLVRGIGSAALATVGERPWDRSAYFNEYNRNKRGVTLDLAHPDGRDALLALVRTADALIENYRADVLDRLGLGVAALHAVRPDLVIVSMPGFAKHGSEREMVGYGPTIEQMGGLVALTGYADGPPQKTGVSYGDPVAGVIAAGALVTALLRRQQDGRGVVVEVSQRDNLIGLIGEAVLDWQMTGRYWPRNGNRHPRMAPHGCYPCRPLPPERARPLGVLGQAAGTATDQWVALAVATDQQWRTLCTVIGRPELAADPAYATADARRERQDELDALIRAWTAKHDDDEAAELLQAHGIPAAPVRTPLSLTRDAHLAARDFYREVVHAVAGRHRVSGPVWNLSAPRVSMRRAAPAFGQHNAEVLGGLLGLTPERLDDLRAAGVIGDTPRLTGSPV